MCQRHSKSRIDLLGREAKGSAGEALPERKIRTSHAKQRDAFRRLAISASQGRHLLVQRAQVSMNVARGFTAFTAMSGIRQNAAEILQPVVRFVQQGDGNIHQRQRLNFVRCHRVPDVGNVTEVALETQCSAEQFTHIFSVPVYSPGNPCLPCVSGDQNFRRHPGFLLMRVGG